jgi:YVTN family beta-propeller protein
MRTATRLALALFTIAATGVVPLDGATLLVANKSDNTVDLVDVATGASLATLPTGHGPHEAAVSPDGRTAVISNYGHRGKPGATLTVIDLGKGDVVRTIDLDPHTRPHGLAWISDETIAVTTEGSAHLLVVDPFAGQIVRTIETAQRISHMVAVTPDGKRAFVANIGSGNVTAIDLDEGRKLADIETGKGAEGIAVTPDGKRVWVSNREADTLSVIDTSTLEVLATVPCRGYPIRVAITPDGRRVLVSCAETGEVVVIDGASHEELLRRKLDLSTVPTASMRLFGDRFGESPVPVGLVIAPEGETAWVAATQADAVVVFNPESLEVVDLIKAGQEPDGMAYSPADVARARQGSLGQAPSTTAQDGGLDAAVRTWLPGPSRSDTRVPATDGRAVGTPTPDKPDDTGPSG